MKHMKRTLSLLLTLCMLLGCMTVGVMAATVAASYEGGTLKLTFTGVADGVATVTVDYSCTTYGGSDSIYGEHSGAALGKLYYTVKVGTGSSTPPLTLIP